MASDRIIYLDALRGIAIIFVVMGHTVQFNMISYSANDVFNFIYSFHMPLFFIISGMAAAIGRSKIQFSNATHLIYSKIRSLIVPFLSWSLIIPAIISPAFDLREIHIKLITLLQSPDKGTWFLLTLFMIYINYFVVCFVSNYFKNQKVEFLTTFVVLCGVVGGKILTGNSFYFSAIYNVAFFVGYFFMRYNLSAYINKYIVLVCIFLFCFYSVKFDFQESSTIMKLGIGLMAFLFWGYIAQKMEYKFCKKTAWLGQNTLEIYVMHYYVVKIFSVEMDVSVIKPIPLFIVIAMISIIVCIVVTYIGSVIKKIPLMGFLLFGKRDIIK